MKHTTHNHRMILHVDADAFFASCTQATHVTYQGKPLVTGRDRGMVIAVSYEAKARGVRRGMLISEAKKICPELIAVESDYETYSLFSRRLFAILRRYTSEVEEYSVDEAFLDITGLRKPLKMSYEKIAKDIQKTIKQELNITVSVGLAPTKVLAKVASNKNKPYGFVKISNFSIEKYLKSLPVHEIWGVGNNTASYMNKLGIFTALDFVRISPESVIYNFTKPHQEIWRELQGELVYPVITEEKTSYASISKTRTFSPASSNKTTVYAELIRNLEGACSKARFHGLVAKRITIFLKTQQFTTVALEACLTRASAYPKDITAIAHQLFDSLYKNTVQYRATGIVLSDLQENTSIQQSLFESPVELQRLQHVYDAVDNLTRKFGSKTIHLAASMKPKATPLSPVKTVREMKEEKELAFSEWLKNGGILGNKHLNIPQLFGTMG